MCRWGWRRWHEVCFMPVARRGGGGDGTRCGGSSPVLEVRRQYHLSSNMRVLAGVST